MSDEHTEPTTNPANSNSDGRRHRRRHNNRPRTMRWYHETNVGTEDLRPNVVMKFFISIAEDTTPEIYFLPMNRDAVVREDGAVGFKPAYAGDIERNAIPLSITDLESVWNAMVSMKSKLLRMQDEFHGRTRDYTDKKEPKRSQQPPQPLTHRIEIPKQVLKSVAARPQTPTLQQVLGSLNWG